MGVPDRQISVLPPILNSVRQYAERRLSTLLQDLFNNTDDALFQLADRSRIESDQHMFFESMRQIRLHRKNISTQFVNEFHTGFDTMFQPGGDVESLHADDGMDQLSSTHSDELEVSVAIAGIVSKVTSQFSLPIMQLTKRIDHLCKTHRVTERLNPLGPERISQSFVCAIETLNLHIKVRIILLKLFERFVMESLGSMYEHANGLLAEAGVPSHSQTMPRQDLGSQSGTGASPEHQAASDKTAPPAPDSFGAIQNLLAAARGAEPGPPEEERDVISTPQVVTMLTDAQADADRQSFDLSQPPPPLDVRQTVVARAERGSGHNPPSMAQTDEDTVNFIAMLFDYILDDRNLAIPMKALIGRLQIPIVKLGIIDKSFFENSGHPARQLLNELSSAGIGWSATTELRRDALYDKIESIVLRVMNGFKQDPNIFAELLMELRDFVTADEKQHAPVEQRTKETETDKAKTIAAKTIVQQLINQKASGMRLPPEVGRFVSNTWSKVLVHDCANQGTASAVWLHNVQALDDLLWCLQPLDNTADLQRREALVPDLLADLDRGMAHLELTQTQRRELIEMLGGQLTQMSDNDRAFLEEDETPNVHPPFEALDEIVLTTARDVPKSETIAPPEPEFVAAIDNLHEGIWVEFAHESGDRVRCKLAAIVEPGDRYVFVNRRGMKVVEKTRTDLALELKKKTMTILDESQVFDRALQAVIGNLRQIQHPPQASSE